MTKEKRRGKKKQRERENDVEVKIVSANVFTVGIDFKAHDVFIRHFRPACPFTTHTIGDGSLSGAVLAATAVPLAARNAARGRGEGIEAPVSPCSSICAA